VTLALGTARLAIADVVRLSAPGGRVALPEAALARIEAAAQLAARFAQEGRPVYGLNTGLGGNLGHRVTAEEMQGFQARIVRGRTIALGPPLPEEACRAAMLCRLAELAAGTTGVSVAACTLLAEMFNRGVTPVLPGFGSIGASDIGMLGHLASVMLGAGEAWYEGTRMPGAQALARAGLAPLQPAAKDGLALVSHGAVTSALAALVLHRIGGLLAMQMRALALAMEGYAGNPAILDPRFAEARPAPGQAEAAAWLRQLLDGSALHAPGTARNLQDALCFRLGAPLMGSALAALAHAVAVTETEVNGSTVTPIVLAEAGEILSTPNFHAPALALALDALAMAVAHAACAGSLRICKLMTARFSGLPAYLSPVGGGSAGYVSVQKTTADLQAEIRIHAVPSGGDVLAVSDTAEDIAPLTLHAVRKLQRQVEPLRYLVAIEALAAAQAVDLRGLPALGQGTRGLHAAIRTRVPPLAEDREPAPDIEAVAALLDAMAAQDDACGGDGRGFR
jgi:histidine ammonia-lyase